MSIKEKLRNLIKTIEELDIDSELEGILEEEEEEEEELLEAEPEEALEEEEEVYEPEELEIPFEECKPVVDNRNLVINLKHDLGIALHNWERQKIYILNKIAMLEESMQEQVEVLREEAGLPEDVNYMFTIPDTPDQPGLFKKS